PPALGVEELLAEVKTPVLTLSVDNDQYIPPATTGQIVDKLHASRVSREHISDPDAGLKLDHFLSVKAGSAVAPRIRAWQGRLSYLEYLSPISCQLGAGPGSGSAPGWRSAARMSSR